MCLRAMLAIGVLTSLAAVAQSTPPQSLALRVAEDAEHFTYSIPHPEQVRGAWLEVYDRPLLLDKKSVPVQARGEVAWSWNHNEIVEDEMDEDRLTLALWDPNGETIICDENTVMRGYPGGEVSPVDIGRRDGEALDPIVPEKPLHETAVITSVYPFPVRLMDEHGPAELKLIIRGHGFKRDNRVILHIGHYTTGNKDLQWHYVSENTLWTWIPRQYWRKHKFVYRLVVETTAGKRETVEVIEAPEEE